MNLLLLLSLISGSPAIPAPQPTRNVVLICIDTLRADRLGCYGHDRDTSPNLDRLAAGGLRFERAYAAAPWTLPSVATLFTGLTPDSHRAENFQTPISPQARLLASLLSEAGFKTQGMVGNYFLQPLFGLHRGYDHFEGGCLIDRAGTNSACLSDEAVTWIQTDANPGFFLYLHYFDPHYNYQEHEGFTFGGESSLVTSGADIWDLRDRADSFQAADWDRLYSLYDSEVAFTDFHVGRVLDALEQRGFAKDTYVIVTADHGENLGEHDWIGHTIQLYEETVRIPLILKGPGIPAGVSGEVVQLSDVTPTLLDLLEIPEPFYGLQGISLRRHFAGAAGATRAALPTSEREAYVAVHTTEIELPRDETEVAKRRSFEKDNWKILVDVDEAGEPSYRIFKTDNPKGFRKKLPENHPEIVSMLLQAIEDDYQERLGQWRQSHSKRNSVVAHMQTLIVWPFKYIRDENRGTEELYNLDQDPKERQNLAAEQPDRLGEFRNRLEACLADLEAKALADPPTISRESAESHRYQVEALGYTRDQ